MMKAALYRRMSLSTSTTRRIRYIPALAVASNATTGSSSETPPLPRVVLKGGKAKLFSELGNPIVYSGAIDRVVGRPAPVVGDPVLVQDGSERTLCWGLWNPTSMFRVRIFQLLSDDTAAHTITSESIPGLLRDRIHQAVDLRKSIGLPNPGVTNVYRLCNSEGDGLSGLIVDVLGDKNMVVSSSAAWCERYKDTIQDVLKQATGIQHITWRPSMEMLIEEGWITAEDAAAAKELEKAASNEGTNNTDVEILEHGIKYLANPTTGQKTGFYSDQREHRARIRQLSKDKTVLDVCCFTGGFSINAAVGGAVSVVGIDTSVPALDLARRNAENNGVSERVEFIKADAAAYMREAHEQGKQYDIVVLDPPKLAPNKKAMTSALRKYNALNQAALRLVKPGGLLMTCSCSGAVSQGNEFLPMLQAAAKRTKRRITLLGDANGAAADHVLDIGFPEGKYLTNVLVRVV